MSNALLMQEIQSRSNFLDYLSGIVLGEANVLLDARQQWSTVDFLKYQVEFLLILKELDQLEDIWMTLAMMECLHLSKDSSSCMARYLVDDFNSTFYIGE
jgi:hypothetical protein